MEILRSDDDGIRTLRLVGNFDTTDVETFHAHIEEAIDEQCFRVLVDSEQMRFINSTALGSLIRAQKRLQQYGGDLAICALPSFAGRVFKTLGLDRKIRCFDSDGEASNYLQSVGAEGVDVEGDQQVGFVFSGDDQIAVAGEDPRIGTMKSIGEYGIQFQWENLDDLDVDTMFAAGAVVQLRFRLPLYHESHMFDAIASVVNATVTAGNKVTVQTKFTNLSDVERRAIQQFVRDLRYLKGELSD
jgi:anti-anti-sigma factor